MFTWGNKITMSDEIGEMLADPNALDKEVTFTYINVKHDRETNRRFPLQYAILLAEARRDDKRYKNFEYHISK